MMYKTETGGNNGGISKPGLLKGPIVDQQISLTSSRGAAQMWSPFCRTSAQALRIEHLILRLMYDGSNKKRESRLNDEF